MAPKPGGRDQQSGLGVLAPVPAFLPVSLTEGERRLSKDRRVGRSLPSGADGHP